MSTATQAVGSFFFETIQTVAGVLCVFFILYVVFVQPHQVNGLSMWPTFNTGDYVLTDKISYRTRQPQRGEVVVFHAPERAQCQEGTGCDFIKRIIGIPGDTIAVKDGSYWLNHKKLKESFLPAGLVTDSGDYISNREVTLKTDEYFVSGDNRPHSSDSRSWGSISSKEIVGRVFFRYWPPQSFGKTEQVVITP